ncbi:2OG-Fe(II) oxygenase [Variovorax robiniae]|uniref:2OG-Fe(II) oxygenase n=1 Tax=Variovorax robiniae TaxID=1836199 RepID=A0ABU8XAE2_9BURK
MVLDDFVGDATAQRLLEYAIANEAVFLPSKVALGYEGHVDETHRVSKVNPDIESVMPLIEPMIRKAVADAIPRLGLVNVDSYFLEPEIAWSGDGAFFKMHADTLRDRANPRVLTMVLYFHKEPKAFEGGQLRLYGLGAQPGSSDYQEIEPRWDRAVIFPSWFPHEVLPVRCRSTSFEDGRFALNCWVHRISGNAT